MIRWGLFIIGIGILLLAVVAHFQQPALPTTPRKVTVAEAVQLASGSTKEYVALEAAVDSGVKIYSTPSVRPVYTGRPTDKTHPILASEGEDTAGYLGCFVHAERGAEKSFIALQTVKDRAFKEGEVLSERILAPLQGTGLKVWVISKVFPQSSAGEKQEWLRRASFEGALTRLKELEANVTHPPVSHDWGEIRAFVQKEFAVELPEDAFLIVADCEWDFNPLYYSPVQGSENTLFVALNKKTEGALPPVLTGVLDPEDLKLYQDFATILPKSPPPRIGILVLQTAQAFNDRRASNVRDMLLVGGICTFLGSLGILWRRVRSRARNG